MKKVSKKGRRIAVQRAIKIVDDIRKRFNGKYKFNVIYVGSGKWNTVIKDEKGHYDVDYRICLTANCKADLNDANQIKEDFFNAINNVKMKNEKVENSTSVVTIRVSNEEGKFNHQKEIYSIDLAIMREKKFIRRSGDHYVWNELTSKHADVFAYFKKLPKVAQKSIMDKVISRKIDEKKKPNKDDRIPSFVLTVEEINNYKG